MSGETEALLRVLEAETSAASAYASLAALRGNHERESAYVLVLLILGRLRAAIEEVSR